MQKIFLSHSSTDKERYVRQVSEKLIKLFGEESIIFDEISFQEGRKTIEEIDEMLDVTDLFVFFCSNKSLDSEWVQHELFRAGELWNDNRLNQICPIIIEQDIKYDDNRIPEWMRRNYNLQYISQPSKAARIIQQRMIEVSFEKHPKLKERQEIFVGRNEQISLFEERMDDFEQEKPICVVASGINDVGRKTLLKHCVVKSNIKKTSYPFSVLNLSYAESIEDFILKLADFGFSGNVDINDLMSMEMDVKVSIAAKLVKDIQDLDEIIIIEDEGSIINHEGEVADWFVLVIGSEALKNKLTFCIVAKFKQRYFGENVSYVTKCKFFALSIEELTKKERNGLLTRYLNFENIELELEDIRNISELLSGFPEQIFFAVTLVKERGIQYVRNNTFEIVEFNNKKASAIMKDIEGDSEKTEFLALLSKFDYVSMSYVLDIVGGENRYIKYIEEFISKSLCEYVGVMREYIRVNDTIKEYIVRNGFFINEKHLERIEESVSAFLTNLEEVEYDMPEYLFSLKEALLKGKKVEQQYLVPSLYLKTMNDFYNQRKNKEVILFADKALENEQYMDARIVFEIRYLLCSALAKLKDNRFNTEVHKIKGADYYFLFGFYYRQIGKYDKALEMLNKSMEMRPNFSKAKREMVQVYIGMQDFMLANDLAKENYLNYRDNPYHIQAYFTCLIKSEKSRENREILDGLISSLAGINSEVSKEMEMRCRAQMEAFYNDSQETALKYINQAIDMNSNIQYARIVKFDICERFGLIEEMRDILSFFKQHEYKTKYHNNIICFEAMLLAINGEVERASRYFIDNIRDYTDEAKDKYIARLNKYLPVV